MVTVDSSQLCSDGGSFIDKEIFPGRYYWRSR